MSQVGEPIDCTDLISLPLAGSRICSKQHPNNEGERSCSHLLRVPGAWDACGFSIARSPPNSSSAVADIVPDVSSVISNPL